MKTSFKNGVCERCCKHVSQHDGSVHTCTPTNGWREMEAEVERLRTEKAEVARTAWANKAEAEQLRVLLKKARAGLADGLWDFSPDQDEHEQCSALVAEIDAVLFHNSVLDELSASSAELGGYEPQTHNSELSAGAKPGATPT